MAENFETLMASIGFLTGQVEKALKETFALLDEDQVWSLSSYKVSRHVLTNELDQVLSVSLLMTSSTALAN